MRRLGHRVTDVIAEHLAGIRSEPVIGGANRQELNAALMRPAPVPGTAFEDLLASLQQNVFPYHAREPHPGFMAYVPSCPTFPALLGDWIATGYNFFAGVWPVASGPNTLELVVLEWFREWMGLPEGAGGLLTSGGSAANTTAVVAARHAAVENGADIAQLTAYTSSEAHSAVTRAAWIAGIPRGNVRVIGVDESLRMRVDLLERALDEDRLRGFHPFLIGASAGTTSTGSVDPLHALADIGERDKIWFHVDAAYAGFAALTSEGKRLLSGIERADTLTLDPHKWLFVPFECGSLLARDPAALQRAFRIAPEYLKDVEAGTEEVNFTDRGEQLTRYSRALKIWFSVGYFGTGAIAAEIQAALDRARLCASLVREATHLEVLSPAQFGIVCFRARTPVSMDAKQADALNARVLARVVGEQRFLISSTRIRDAYSLRMCTLGFRTTSDDIRELVASAERAAAAELTP